MDKKYYFHLDGKYYSKISIVRIIKKYGQNVKDFYDKNYRQIGEGICPNCEKETPFTKFSYRKYCDVKCSGKHLNNVSKIYNGKNRDSSIEKLKNYRKNLTKEEKDKRERKRIQTVESNVGMKYEDYMRFHMNRRFDEMSDDEYSSWFDKSTSSIKNPYGNKKILLNENIVTLQGYEPQVLDVLKTLFEESKIQAGRNKVIKYIHAQKEKRYFPDFIINNILIEVKSRYTLNLNKEITVSKLYGAKQQGFIPLLMLWNPKNKEMCKNSLIETISSQDLTQQVRFNDYPFIGVGDKQMISEVLGIQIN